MRTLNFFEVGRLECELSEDMLTEYKNITILDQTGHGVSNERPPVTHTNFKKDIRLNY